MAKVSEWVTGIKDKQGEGGREKGRMHCCLPKIVFWQSACSLVRPPTTHKLLY